jgi:hypothetical protein
MGLIALSNHRVGEFDNDATTERFLLPLTERAKLRVCELALKIGHNSQQIPKLNPKLS